jgi:hypothetical protein
VITILYSPATAPTPTADPNQASLHYRDMIVTIARMIMVAVETKSLLRSLEPTAEEADLTVHLPRVITGFYTLRPLLAGTELPNHLFMSSLSHPDRTERARVAKGRQEVLEVLHRAPLPELPGSRVPLAGNCAEVLAMIFCHRSDQRIHIYTVDMRAFAATWKPTYKDPCWNCSSFMAMMPDLYPEGTQMVELHRTRQAAIALEKARVAALKRERLCQKKLATTHQDEGKARSMKHPEAPTT